MAVTVALGLSLTATATAILTAMSPDVSARNYLLAGEKYGALERKARSQEIALVNKKEPIQIF